MSSDSSISRAAGSDDQADAHRRFNELVGELDYPMFIATAARGEERAGCLVGFATQGSIDPPRVLVCISDKNRTLRIAWDAPVVAVHFVPDTATELADLFGGETGDEIDKFDRCDWRPGPHGVPLLCDCANRFVGAVLERFVLGDHVGFLLDPIEVSVGAAQAEFSFHRARRIEPGHPA